MKLVKVLSVFIMFLFSVIAVSAVDVTINEVELDEDTLNPNSSTNSVKDFKRDQELDVKVHFTANEDADDIQVEVVIRGYDHNDLIEDITDTFDVKSGVSYTKKLTIPLRERLDQDRYLLRVRIEGRSGNTVSETYALEVETARHSIQIRDFVLSPGEEVRAGRALLAAVRLRNRGEKDEEGIKVTVSIPELGVSATDFVDELEKDDSDDDETTSEELYLRIPNDAVTGEYTLRTVVEYDDGDEKETSGQVIRVLGTEGSATAPTKSQEKTIITVAADAQSLQTGGVEVAYPITLTNAGSSSRTYTVSANGASWATFRVSPSNVVVVDAGESKAVSVYVAANANAPAGQQTFTVTVSSADKVLKQIPLSATVSAVSGTAKLKRGLEVGLVVLVVLLVIVGLIIGFNKLRGEEGKEGEEETYY